jgi:hypothetical protein
VVFQAYRTGIRKPPPLPGGISADVTRDKNIKNRKRKKKWKCEIKRGKTIDKRKITFKREK